MAIMSNHDITFSSTQKDSIEKPQKNDIKNQHIADVKANKGAETSEKLIVFAAKTTALTACGAALLFPLTAPIIVPIAQVSGAVALIIITRKFIKST
ncbi:TPA: hypothetical protein RJD49_001016 [Legionella pneumophila]|nr:hypothetical protein [Legionella pneumophila]HDV5805158.1 hypothetical protein [Legionella pneumophila]